jgi:hypothetical protein
MKSLKALAFVWSVCANSALWRETGIHALLMVINELSLSVV